MDASTKAVWFTVQALPSNTGTVCVGGPAVAASYSNGMSLAPGKTFTFHAIQSNIYGDYVYDLSTIWIDASVNGEGVSYTYTARGQESVN